MFATLVGDVGRIFDGQIINSRVFHVYAKVAGMSPDSHGSSLDVGQECPICVLLLRYLDSLFDVLDHFANSLDDGFDLHHVAGDIGVVGLGADRVGFAKQLLGQEIQFATVCFV